jgi:hypothetical protein
MRLKKKIKKYYHCLMILLFCFFRKEFKGLEVANAKAWRSNFIKRIYVFGYSSMIERIWEFINARILIVKKLNFKANRNLIAITVIKDDLKNLRKFLKHHRNLGIRQFAFLDDNSTDGTREYLQEQQDVELFESSDSYLSGRRVAWINRILAYYGSNRWYAVLDSDELLVYDNYEKCKIDEFITLIEKEKKTAVSGKMIDMYFHNGTEYFDKTGYFENKKNRKMSNTTGGMRYRIFGLQVNLSKTPLLFFNDKMIYQAHFLFSLDEKIKKNALALLHYKFLDGDLGKYKERVNNKCMHNDSEEYKKYIEKMNDENLNFYDENISEKYIGSKSLIENGLLKGLDIK